MKKQVLFLIPLSLVLFSCGKKEDVLRYELNVNSTYTAILDSNSTEKKISVPKKHDGVVVTELSGFRNNSYIEEVTFSSYITKIDDGSFMFCENLKKISVKDSKYYKTIDGSLYKDDTLLVYASGKTDEVVSIDKNINSKAFTLAPRIKELKINSSVVSENSVYFLENLETIYLGENVTTLSNDFQMGNSQLNKLVINNDKITSNLEVKDIKEVYVLDTATLSDQFLDKYFYKKMDTYNNVLYKVYEVIK